MKKNNKDIIILLVVLGGVLVIWALYTSYKNKQLALEASKLPENVKEDDEMTKRMTSIGYSLTEIIRVLLNMR